MKTTLKTSLSVQQIQLALYRHLFDGRSETVVPNVSWGLLEYEADLLGISQSGQVTEVEIKRSLQDLKADFRKHHRHDDSCVTYFYYCVPECLEEQAKEAILENERAHSPTPERITPDDCPCLLTFREDGTVHPTGFGTAKRSGFHRRGTEDKATLGRLGTLRFWTLLEKTAFPENFGANAKIRALQEENRGLKRQLENCREDLQDISRFLRKEHPEIWKEYINKQ